MVSRGTAQKRKASSQLPRAEKEKRTASSTKGNKQDIRVESEEESPWEEEDEDEDLDEGTEEEEDYGDGTEDEEAISSEDDEGFDVEVKPLLAINPYAVLGVEKSADERGITTAYRKAALKCHPDRLPADQKEAGKIEFQQVAFAYSILSDPARRARYDRTGRTDDFAAGNDDSFNWHDFFNSALRETITAAAIEAVRKEYRYSDEERRDVLKAYIEQGGDMAGILEHVMLSDEVDEARFEAMIEQAIEQGEVDRLAGFGPSMSKKGKKARAKRRGKEEAEAMALAKELGVEKALFGTGASDECDDDEDGHDHSDGTGSEGVTSSSKSASSKGRSKGQNVKASLSSKAESKSKVKSSSKSKPKSSSSATSQDSLAQLIQSRAKQRHAFLDSLVHKYGGDEALSGMDEPPEEAFLEMGRRGEEKRSKAAAAAGAKTVSSSKNGKGRGKKRG